MTLPSSLAALRLPATLAAGLLLAALSGCGQTGPLHLPQDAPAKENYLLKKRAAPDTRPAQAAQPAAAPAADPVPPEAPALDPPKP